VTPPECAVTTVHDGSDNPIVQVEIPETPDLPGATLIFKFTGEGLIVDGFQDGDPTATFSNTYDEFYGEMIR
jgi:hypothetical protein